MLGEGWGTHTIFATFYKHNSKKFIKNSKVNRNLTSDKQEGKIF